MQNPYAPPTGDVVAPAAPALSEQRLASRGKRLGAAIIDTIVVVVLGTVLSRSYCAIASVQQSVDLARLGILVAWVPQWFLIASRGQTIGKMLLKTKIVVVDGSAAGFFHGVVLRSWPVLFLSSVPAMLMPNVQMLSSLIMMIDPLFIFRTDHRCVHDRIAGTYVVDV
jgi:uncharacterized RDD family membrane protein YckC